MNYENDEKYVDESWKDSVESEKEKGPEKLEAASQSAPSLGEEPASRQEEQSTGPINFLDYITSLAFQAMIFLGEVPHPMTDKSEKNLPQAKLLIDTLVLLREKTRGNLTKTEEDTLNAAVYELQMRFVDILQKEQPHGQ